MARQQRILECSFLVPIRRDANLSDGKIHARKVWYWLDRSLFEKFGGATLPSEHYRGFYRDPDTGEKVNDESAKYIVAISANKIDELRALLAVACEKFQQKCIYLSVAGKVEFIEVRR